jgi:hypothetical protein
LILKMNILNLSSKDISIFDGKIIGIG